MNRRDFLRGLGATGAGLALSGIPSRGDSPETAPTLGRIAYQLGWIKNFQFAGEYIAEERNYYRKFGLEVDLHAGGPGMIVDPIVVSGVALVGQSTPNFMSHAIAQGARLKCIGANFQKNSSCIVSMAKTPLVSPRDLIGRRIGLQTNNLLLWHAFLKVNRIDPASITSVPVQFDFAPLINGDVDGFFGEVNDDVVDLRARGYEVHCLLFADFGCQIFDGTYSVLEDSLADKTKRAQLVAFMKGEVLGWQDAIKDPALGARLTTEVYGTGNGLDPKIEEASCRATSEFIVSADTEAHGLFWMTPAAVERTVTALAAAGVKTPPGLFTNEILEEVYQGRSALSA